MIDVKKYPTSTDELIEVVRDVADGASTVVAQAGHFLVYHDNTENLLLPCIESELHGPRHDVIRHEVSRFPLLSWQLALDILDFVQAVEKKILVLVNDWQYLPTTVDRASFYDMNKKLPGPYVSALRAAQSQISLLIPQQNRGMNTGDFFSEQSLRNSYIKQIKNLIAEKTLPEGADITIDGEQFSCTLADAVGNKQEIYCAGKRPNCTHEVAELIRLVYELTKCDVFLNLFPQACTAFIEKGTELGVSIFNSGIKKVVNIGIPSSGVINTDDLLSGCCTTVHSF